MEPETVCDLRRTNIFLRLVLFLFTLIIVGAAVALFLVGSSSQQATGIFLLIFAAISYAAAEFAVSQARLYRYGIEEALAVCSVGLLCAGLQVASRAPGTESLVPAAGAALWIRRWLAGGPGGIRRGFTAQRLSGRDKAWMNAGAVAFGLTSAHPTTQTDSTDFPFGGGDSGGGGASSDW